MANTKTHPWDPADHILDGEDVIAYLKMATPEEYDPVITLYFLDCIARSSGVAEITSVDFHEQGGNRSVTVTTVNGTSATIVIAPDVDADSIRNALVPTPAPEPISP